MPQTICFRFDALLTVKIFTVVTWPNLGVITSATKASTVAKLEESVTTRISKGQLLTKLRSEFLKESEGLIVGTMTVTSTEGL